MVEAPLAFLEEEMEVVLGNAVVLAQVALGLVPEVLDAVDVVGIGGKALAMIDPMMAEARDIEIVVGSCKCRYKPRNPALSWP